MPSTYYMSPYSPATWQAAVEHLDNRQTAFAESHLRMAKKSVRAGDVFLCYIIGEKEIVAALRATSEAYVGGKDRVLKLMFFPVRVDTEIMSRVPIGDGVALSTIKERSAQPRTWISLVQGALKRVPKEDGDWIVKELRRREMKAGSSR